MDTHVADAYVLDEGADYALAEVASVQRWTEFPHFPQRERGLVILAGEILRVPLLHAGREQVLWMRCLRGLPEISADGLDVEAWQFSGDVARLLFTLRMDNSQPLAGLHEVELALPTESGGELHLEIRCGAGPDNDPRADWLGLLGLVVCPRSELALRKAQSKNAWRLTNEIAHFQHVYDRDFYRDRNVERSGATVRPLRSLPVANSNEELFPPVRAALETCLRGLAPVSGENAFRYAHRMLQAIIPQSAPDFAARLCALSKARRGAPVRWLSLCAGSASIEGALLERAGVPVELCLVDVNADLLETAAIRMPANVRVDRVLGNANEIGPALGAFDIINITSGLHHLVELEHVLGSIARMLQSAGEFWLIGEQVGRNGNRLWPEAAAVANVVFSSWPPAKRTNQNTGRIDTELPDIDCSSASFEGIRSQDINGLIDRYFLPIERYLRDAFLWRLVDVAYAANFDPADAGDRKLLRQAVIEEALLWANGARGTELHGAFRSKWTALENHAALTAEHRHSLPSICTEFGGEVKCV